MKHLSLINFERNYVILMKNETDWKENYIFILRQNYSSRLQARLLAEASRREHVTTVLQALGWLPVPFLDQLKMLVIPFKSLAILRTSTQDVT